MKLEGKWYISILDVRETSTYPDATEVVFFEQSPWLTFKSADGKVHITSFPANLRTGSK